MESEEVIALPMDMSTSKSCRICISVILMCIALPITYYLLPRYIILHTGVQTFNSNNVQPRRDFHREEVWMKRLCRTVPPLDRYPRPILWWVRVPKTGSTTLKHVIDHVTKTNDFVLATNRRSWKNFRDETERATLPVDTYVAEDHDRQLYARRRMESQPKTMTYIADHVQTLDEMSLREGHRPVLQISVLREPLDWLKSFYGFIQQQPWAAKLRNQVFGQNLSHCLSEEFPACDTSQRLPPDQRLLWMQFPLIYLCGYSARCYTDREWSSERAIRHVLDDTFVFVGLSEQLDETLSVFEFILPEFLRTATSFSPLRRVNSGRRLDLTVINKREERLLLQKNSKLVELYERTKELFTRRTAYVKHLKQSGYSNRREFCNRLRIS